MKLNERVHLQGFFLYVNSPLNNHQYNKGYTPGFFHIFSLR